MHEMRVIQGYWSKGQRYSSRQKDGRSRGDFRSRVKQILGIVCQESQDPKDRSSYISCTEARKSIRAMSATLKPTDIDTLLADMPADTRRHRLGIEIARWLRTER